MRILHVVESTTAGVRRHIEILTSTIDQRRYQVLVACPPFREQPFGDLSFVNGLEQRGIECISVPMVRSIRPSADAQALRRLYDIVHSQQIDLVHCHSSKAGFLGRLAARAVGVPSIYTPHGLYFLGLPPSPKRRFFVLLEQLAGRLSDRIIAVSPGERNLILRHHIAPPERVVCIENATTPPQLDPSYDRQAMRNSLGATADGPLIGTVARLAEQKNPRRFLEAAAALLAKLPSARFVWCGSGELADAAEHWAIELGIAHAVRFLGHREDVPAVLSAFDIFWLTSNYEGLPGALLEAMMLGIPIVATDVVGIRDALQGIAGLVAPTNDPHIFARATLMLLQRPDRATRLAATAQTLVRERWSAEQLARKTEALYDQVVGSPPLAVESVAARLNFEQTLQTNTVQTP